MLAMQNLRSEPAGKFIHSLVHESAFILFTAFITVRNYLNHLFNLFIVCLFHLQTPKVGSLVYPASSHTPGYYIADAKNILVEFLYKIKWWPLFIMCILVENHVNQGWEKVCLTSPKVQWSIWRNDYPSTLSASFAISDAKTLKGWHRGGLDRKTVIHLSLRAETNGSQWCAPLYNLKFLVLLGD